ncbi:MAG: ferric reductase-like transmembrane domain-containing protein [Thermoleophilia bacterium]|nr:ferric reductase-like transmembrane domain-containing protein [Thermoleophilia bacterium]
MASAPSIPSDPPGPPVRSYPLWLAWANRPSRAIAVALAISLVVLLGSLMLEGRGAPGLRAATRHTAQVAYPFFLAAFLASSIARLWPGPLTRALLARRRALGLAFATAQIVHGAAILLYGRLVPETLAPDFSFVGGAVGFVFVGAMAATSNDVAREALGRRAWRALHQSGQWVLFVIYAVTYAGRVALDAAAWPGLALLLAALAIRIAAALQSRSLRSRTLPIE